MNWTTAYNPETGAAVSVIVRQRGKFGGNEDLKDKVFLRGMRDGLPIGMGYFAVAFSLGITAQSIGFDALQGFVMSLLNVASAGEYAGLACIATKAALYELALLTLITNARYLLMSCALSQKLPENTSLMQRLLVGFGVTDELFGIAIAYKGKVQPVYLYGAYLVAIPMWAIGTAVGVVAGNLLPQIVVNALSVAIFGMFIAIIIPPAKENRVVAGTVIISFCFSALLTYSHLLDMSDGTRTILLTILISGFAAAFFPVKDEEEKQ